MKATKRILAIVMCICLAFGCLTVTAFADATGSITVENQSGSYASVAGKTLNLFKIFDATSSGDNISYQWITDSEGNNKYESFFFGTDGVVGESGTIHDVVAYISGLEENSLALSQMAAALHGYIHENSITPDKTGTVGDSATSYTFDGLTLGYYLVYDATVFADDTEAVRSAAMLTHSGQNKVIQLKADRPHITKTVNDGTQAAPEWKTATTASVGDTVSFRITTAVPDHSLYGDSYVFEIYDVMADELSLVKDSITVSITEVNAAEGEATEPNSTTYDIVTDTTKLDEGVDFKVVFTDITDLDQGSVVEIIYDAVVTDTAAFKNLNTAYLKYSNDPNNLTSTGEVDSEANVLLWQFVLTKYMEDASGTPSAIRLSGAEFEIYAKDDLTNPIKFSATELTTQAGVNYLKYTYDPVDGAVTTLATQNTGDDGKTDIGYTDGGNLGEILIFGLGEGEYVIRETKAPDGYQVAKGDFEFTLTDVVGTTGAIANAELTTTARTVKPGQFTRVLVQEANQKYYVGITNAPGDALPETGGMGTTLFTVSGIILMVGALAFFTLRKRSRA